MSLDTIKRINSYFKSSVAEVDKVFTIYENENKNLPDSNVGPNIRLFIEVGSEVLFSDSLEYEEEGIIIAQISTESGKSKTSLHKIADTIRVAFRDGTLLSPIADEVGTILFKSPENVARGEFPRSSANGRAKNSSAKMWKRLDVMIEYSKFCS